MEAAQPTAMPGMILVGERLSRPKARVTLTVNAATGAGGWRSPALRAAAANGKPLNVTLPAGHWDVRSDRGSASSGRRLGLAVCTPGAANGDGCTDVIIGAKFWSAGPPEKAEEGCAFVHRGSVSGPSTVSDWHIEPKQNAAHFGTSVGTAGDVNGDGYADVIVGAPDCTRSVTDEGQAFVFYGNGGSGAPLRLRQRKQNSFALGRLGPSGGLGFKVWLQTTSPSGRGRHNCEIEAIPLGRMFDGTDTFFQPGPDASWDLPIGPLATNASPNMTAERPYHWRIRTVYDPATTPWMPASRWATVPWNGWNETDLRIGGNRIGLPLILQEHEG